MRSDICELVTYLPVKLNLIGCAKIELGGYLILCASLVFASSITQRLAPFQMEPSPVGRVFLSFLELGHCETGTVFSHQRLAPHPG
jgi:hypothetical protein